MSAFPMEEDLPSCPGDVGFGSFSTEFTGFCRSAPSASPREADISPEPAFVSIDSDRPIFAILLGAAGAIVVFVQAVTH
jgi:hypothetical protein